MISRGPHKLANHRRAGVALMMVVFAIAMAAVLGVAILATTSMQTQVKGNIIAAAQADSLAESGVNLGLYYLQFPNASGSVDFNGLFAGASSVSLGATMPGYIDIIVSNNATNTYDITAVAHTSSNLTRSLTVRAYLNTAYQQTKALSAAGSFTMPSYMSVTGDVRVDGNLNVAGGATISGSVKASSTTNYPTFTAPESFPIKAAPSINEIEIYNTLGAATPYYNYVDVDGTTKVGYPQQLPAVASGTFNGAANNPKNVWYSNGNVNLTNFHINGTIVLRNASRRLGIYDSAHIAARSNMPALVAAGSIAFASEVDPSDPKELVIDGLCWTGRNIGTTGAATETCSLQINGALLFGSSVSGVSANYDGMISVTYDASKVQVPNFSSAGATPQSVKILRWGL